MAVTAAPIRAQSRIGLRLQNKRTLLVGLLLLAVFVLVALFPGRLAPYSPTEFDYTAILSPPSRAHLFGTDNFGRDILSRVIWAARVDLQIAIFTTLFPFFFGTLVGAIAGYAGKWVDAIFGRIVDVVVVFPFLVLVIAIVAFLGPGLRNMYIAVSVVGWVAYGRLVRGEMMVQKQAEYAMAARTMGYTSWRIIGRHLLPNVIGSAITYWMTAMSLGILLGASLGYLGLGAQPPTAEWGAMISTGREYLLDQWWVATMPGIAIFLVSLGFNLLGDGLRDVLDPKRT